MALVVGPPGTLDGAVALITGGGGGLGAATASALAEAGMDVVVADVRPDCAEEVAASIRAGGGRASSLRLDVTAEDDAERAVASTLAEYGRLDVLVNNAGIDVTLPLSDLSVADWDRVLAVNLRGPFLMSRAALSALREARGQIVNIVSTAAMRAVEDRICELFAPMGARLAGFYYCPHHPDGSVSQLAIECDCRKPAAGLITRAAEELGIDPGESWMVGDTLDDVEAGNRAGCRTILVDNGNETEWRVDGKRWPSVVVNDLDRAAAVIVGVEEPVKAQYTK